MGIVSIGDLHRFRSTLTSIIGQVMGASAIGSRHHEHQERYPRLVRNAMFKPLQTYHRWPAHIIGLKDYRGMSGSRAGSRAGLSLEYGTCGCVERRRCLSDFLDPDVNFSRTGWVTFTGAGQGVGFRTRGGRFDLPSVHAQYPAERVLVRYLFRVEPRHDIDR